MNKYRIIEKLLKQYLLFALLFNFATISSINGQILHTESFSVILDSAKRLKGSILPNLEFQTQKKDLLEIENYADLSFRIGDHHAFTIANKVELSTFGKETLLSGGYLYAEYRNILEKKLTLEPYSQLHWADARGLELKYAGGLNLRWRILTKDKMGVYLGSGPFYEYEKWNYEGVSSITNTPPNRNPVKSEKLKHGTYISIKYTPIAAFSIDLSGYHQARYHNIFYQPRLANSSGITWNITKHIGLTFIYQIIYDFNPIVPIRKDFHKIIFGLEASF
ncbi:hypothetical protein L21SP5_02824 [Salinivirga cyanobacteriivorans]|uniref:Salt-induced outer membrane protein n=1 Tax=Salinivirga cyanobacteriivorans TaxID=1307839 RepID=A0A0S2I327_9BACT|nr:DUF481 domain-containing protein [Salinivirga cyanobacteriivorans]ALO16444.1 hypothetical protein L21SP5_02824 [Salinivirga cyanobacteriivorans]